MGCYLCISSSDNEDENEDENENENENIVPPPFRSVCTTLHSSP